MTSIPSRQFHISLTISKLLFPQHIHIMIAPDEEDDHNSNCFFDFTFIDQMPDELQHLDLFTDLSTGFLVGVCRKPN
ncbi:hypothetical protein QVD17_19813 [Tagetes erecta]|uniref:Uncharacterized protein n=1 Tax=Tagetes erecta TaxID=13708 RepID=A0AAD8KKH7_TARER|nr:hypothetical protein QVD17_19813 [Tagetes erecta]